MSHQKNSFKFLGILAAFILQSNFAQAQGECRPSAEAVQALKEKCSGSLRLLVGFGPGAGPDAMARELSEYMRGLGVSSIVENKTGASGNIAAQELLKNAQDNNCKFLMAGSASLSINKMIPTLSNTPDPKRFKPVSMVAKVPMFLVVHSNRVKADTLEQFVAESKNKNFNFLSPGLGTSLHLMSEKLRQSTGGGQFTAIPVKSSSEMVTNLMQGDIDFSFVDGATLSQLEGNKQLKILANSSGGTLAGHPPISQAIPGFPAASADFGLVGNDKMDNKIVEAMEQIVSCGVKQSSLIEKYKAQNYLLQSGRAEDLRQAMSHSDRVWQPVVSSIFPDAPVSAVGNIAN